MKHFEYSFMRIEAGTLVAAEERLSDIGGEGWHIHTIRYHALNGSEFPGADVTLERDDELLNGIEEDET